MSEYELCKLASCRWVKFSIALDLPEGGCRKTPRANLTKRTNGRGKDPGVASLRNTRAGQGGTRETVPQGPARRAVTRQTKWDAWRFH